jgi:hypothetical protein
MRDDDEIIFEQIKNIENKFSNIINIINSKSIDSNKINEVINDIFKYISIAENEESII